MANLSRLETGKYYTAQLVKVTEMDGRGITVKFLIPVNGETYSFTKNYWYGSGTRAPLLEMNRTKERFRKEIGADFDHAETMIGAFYLVEKKNFQGHDYLELKGVKRDEQ